MTKDDWHLIFMWMSLLAIGWLSFVNTYAEVKYRELRLNKDITDPEMQRIYNYK